MKSLPLLHFERLPRDKDDDDGDEDAATDQSAPAPTAPALVAPPRRESNIVRGTLTAQRLAVVVEQARKLLALMPARRSEQLVNRLCQFENLDVAGTSRAQLDDLLRRTRGKVLLKVFFDVVSPGAPYITLGVSKSATAREVCQLVCAKRLCPALHRACQLAVVNGSGGVSPMADHDRPAPLSLVWASKNLPPSERALVLRLKPEFVDNIVSASRGAATPSPTVAENVAAPPAVLQKPPQSPTVSQPPLPWRAAPRLDAEVRRSLLLSTPPSSSPQLDRRTPTPVHVPVVAPTVVAAPAPAPPAKAPAEEEVNQVYGFIPRAQPPLSSNDASDLKEIEEAFGGVAAELALDAALDNHDEAAADGEVMTAENEQFFFDLPATDAVATTRLQPIDADAFGVELDSLLELDDLDTGAATESGAVADIDEFQRLLNDVENVAQDLQEQLARRRW